MRNEFKSSTCYFLGYFPPQKYFGCNLEFFACHVTEALCVVYQIVGNLILNKKVMVNGHNWSDSFGVILKRVLFVEKKMAAGRHLEFDKLVPRAQLFPPGS